MNDTPRTDAAELDARIGVSCFDDTDLTAAFKFARELEREIFEWKKISDDWMSKAFENLGHRASARAREEALRKTLESITELAHCIHVIIDKEDWQQDDVWVPTIRAYATVIKEDAEAALTQP